MRITRVEVFPLISQRPVLTPGVLTAISVAADLHLTAALEQARFVEYQTHTPYVDGILAIPFKLNKDGMLPVHTGPGLGVEIDMAALKRHGPK